MASNPDIRALLQQAMALHQQGDPARAESLYREVLGIDPDEPNAWHLLGVMAWQRGDLGQAEESIRKAIKLHNKAAAYYSNLAGVLRQKDDFLGAAEQYEKVLKLDPTNEDAKKELSNALHRHGMKMMETRQLKDAKAAYRRVLALEPDNVATLNNLAMILQHQNDRVGARKLYDHGLTVNPNNLLIRYNRAICYLTEGMLKEGWDDFTASAPHWRVMQDVRANLPWIDLPLWDGLDLTGKKILIWGDQGIGDEVLYASMIPEVIMRGGKIAIETVDRLVPLFQRSFPGVTVVARQSPPLPGKDFDCQSPWMWLSRLLRKDRGAFPLQKSFLKADAAKTKELRLRYEAFGKKKIIGLSWFTGSPAWGLLRSVPLPDMLKHLNLKDILIVDMQYGNTSDAWRQAKKMFPDLTFVHDDEVNQFKDMDVFAAQIAACDGIYTISNTTSHVAGALGVPAIILMNHAGLTWYWFEQGEDCPWYPSLKLLRPDVRDRLKLAAELVGSL